ncbi:MAG: hypothetical protein Q8S33_38710 [Myxococcales bacterium]|nr:hypothetical protein [Myxococcales bacterium]
MGTLDIVEDQPFAPATRAPVDGAADGGSGDAGVDGGGEPVRAPVDAGAALEPVDAGVAAMPPSCSSIASMRASGWRRGPYTRFTEVPSINYSGHFLNPFPRPGSLGRFVTNDEEFLAIEFETPSDAAEWDSRTPAKLFQWGESQVGGEAVMARVFLSISSCPGDFRVPGRGDAPPSDPTFALGCRNVRPHRLFPMHGPFVQSNLGYGISTAPSTELLCHLAPGRRYFLNFVRADARDGVIGAPADEAQCINPGLTTCGVQLGAD